jgi:hypothetical protein
LQAIDLLQQRFLLFFHPPEQFSNSGVLGSQGFDLASDVRPGTW